MRKWVVILLCFFGVSFASQVVYPFKTTRQQAQFQRLTTELRCLVCQNESLADSNASLAADLRQQVHHMVIAGKTDQQIEHYMVARYGDFILFKPPFQWNTVLLWAAPFLLLLLAGWILMTLCRVD